MGEVTPIRRGRMDRDEYELRRREFAARGSKLPQAKLTEEDVRQARKEYSEGRKKLASLQRYYSVEGLAERFGVSKAAMEKALSGATWSHVR